MSPFFVRFFKTENPCQVCSAKQPAAKVPGRTLCGPHLKAARLFWRIWAYDRTRQQLCCNCEAAALKGTGRCRLHRRRNLVKLHRWMATNRQANYDRQKQKRENHINEGRCPGCPEHAPLVPGKRRCDECRRRQAAYGKDPAAVEAINEKRRALKLRRRREAAEAARKELAAMGFGRRLQLPRYASA